MFVSKSDKSWFLCSRSRYPNCDDPISLIFYNLCRGRLSLQILLNDGQILRKKNILGHKKLFANTDTMYFQLPVRDRN